MFMFKMSIVQEYKSEHLEPIVLFSTSCVIAHPPHTLEMHGRLEADGILLCVI